MYLRAVIISVLFLSPITLHADFWGDVVEKSKNVASDIVNDVTEQMGEDTSAVNHGAGNQAELAQPSQSEAQQNKAADGVKEADIDGVSLGMDSDKAMTALISNGYVLDRCASHENSNSKSCFSDLLGVTVKGEKSNGYEKITFRHMGGKVYWFSKRVTYIPKRHMPEDKSIADLKKEYYDRYTKVFDTRYFEQYGAQQMYHFDDESPPPYSRKMTSPHAVLSLNDGRGVLIVGIDMEWKGLVGAAW